MTHPLGERRISLFVVYSRLLPLVASLLGQPGPSTPRGEIAPLPGDITRPRR